MFFLIKWYEQWREVRHCESCETLREQLTIVNGEKQQLLKAILDAHKAPQPIANAESLHELPNPILPKAIPWRVRREMLENEDRKQAELLRNKEREMQESSKSTEELEQELGIKHAT